MKELFNRRIPQILGSYFVAGTSLVLFVEYLVDKYQLPIHYPALALFGILWILSSFFILSYFLCATLKDSCTKF